MIATDEIDLPKLDDEDKDSKFKKKKLLFFIKYC